MDPIGWVLYTVAVGAALAAAVLLYRRLEAPGRGRGVLAAIRWTAVALLLLLLLDPRLPVLDVGGERESSAVLLDQSLSMGVPIAPGEARTRWAAGVDEATRRAGRHGVILVGDAPSRVPVESLREAAPGAPRARLLPALRLAAEAGARRAVFITDRAIVDAVEVEREARDLGVGLEIVDVSGPAFPNLGITEVDAPDRVEAGGVMEVGVTVSGSTPVAGELAVVLSEAGEERARSSIRLPGGGGSATAVLRFEPRVSASDEPVRYDIELQPGDEIQDDDRRSIYVDISDRPAGVAVVSFRPDWEPRFLVPVLEQALGLPTRGYLHAGAATYAAIGTGLEAGRTVGEDRVRADVAAAELVVLHGLGPDAPQWAAQAARTARRVLVLPASDAPGDLGLPITLPAPRAGEWYPSSDVPLSPIAALLQGAPLDALPPLTRVRPVESSPAGSWVALHGRLGARGGQLPLVLAGADQDRRWAVALADGYWQWSFRGGAARQTYRSLWGGLAGWLTETGAPAGAEPARPVRPALPRAERIAWALGGSGLPDSLRIAVDRADGAAVMDTVVRPAADTVFSRPLPPGHYRYRVESFGDAAGTGVGAFTVESYSPEFLRAAAPLEPLAAGLPVIASAAPRAPLHTRAWPFALLVLILSAEWVLRRRWGLR